MAVPDEATSPEFSASDLLGLIVLIPLLLWIGSCMFGGSEPDEVTASKPSVEAVAVSGSQPTSKAVAAPATMADSPAEKNAKALMTADAGPVRYSDLDEGDRAIRLAINLAGYRCAKPILVMETPLSGKYSVTCITNRSGKGRSNFIIDGATERVTLVR